MAITTLEDALYHALKDLLSAEKQFKQILPKLSDAADDDELAAAFSDHLDDTGEQIVRLEQCFEMLGRPERSEKCEAAAGIVEEGQGIINEDGDPPAIDLMLVAAGRKTEHYEIASYEDAADWADQLGLSGVNEMLTITLKEEREADERLAAIGKRLARFCEIST